MFFPSCPPQHKHLTRDFPARYPMPFGFTLGRSKAGGGIRNKAAAAEVPDIPVAGSFSIDLPTTINVKSVAFDHGTSNGSNSGPTATLGAGGSSNRSEPPPPPKSWLAKPRVFEVSGLQPQASAQQQRVGNYDAREVNGTTRDNRRSNLRGAHTSRGRNTYVRASPDQGRQLVMSNT